MCIWRFRSAKPLFRDSECTRTYLPASAKCDRRPYAAFERGPAVFTGTLALLYEFRGAI